MDRDTRAGGSSTAKTQGQPVTKPITPLQNLLEGNVNISFSNFIQFAFRSQQHFFTIGFKWLCFILIRTETYCMDIIDNVIRPLTHWDLVKHIFVGKLGHHSCRWWLDACLLTTQYLNQCSFIVHDDVIKWKHFPRYCPFVRGINRSPVNSPHKGQWRGALMFSLIRDWINAWVNSREAGDMRRYRVHYDVIVMQSEPWILISVKV